MAGGSGTRMGGDLPKQFRSLNGRPVLWWSMKSFRDEDASTGIIIVLPKDYRELWDEYYRTLPEGDRIPHITVTGGTTRSESVKNGLKAVSDAVGKEPGQTDCLVSIHDAARPLVTKEMISRGWKTAAKKGAAIPVIPVSDSLRIADGEGSKAVDRSKYMAVQTPQVFDLKMLEEAYHRSEGKNFTDDAAVMEHAGHKIELFEGSPENFKITNPKDLAIAEVLMTKECQNT